MLAAYTSDQVLLIGGLAALAGLLFFIVVLRQVFRVDQVVKHLEQTAHELAEIRSLLAAGTPQGQVPSAKAN